MAVWATLMVDNNRPLVLYGQAVDWVFKSLWDDNA